jgi:hypothetical protein
MKVEVIFRFESGGQMSDRSKRFAEKFQKAKEQQSINDAASLQRDKVLSESFSRMRSELKKGIERDCEEINQEPQIGKILAHRLALTGDKWEVTRTDTGSVLSIEFDPLLHTVSFSCEKPAQFRAHIELKPITGGTCYYATEEGNHTGIDETLGRAFCALLGIESSGTENSVWGKL